MHNILISAVIYFAKLLLESTVHGAAHQCTTLTSSFVNALYRNIFNTFYIGGSSLLGCYVTSTDKQLLMTRRVVEEQCPLVWTAAVLRMEALHSAKAAQQPRSLEPSTLSWEPQVSLIRVIVQASFYISQSVQTAVFQNVTPYGFVSRYQWHYSHPSKNLRPHTNNNVHINPQIQKWDMDTANSDKKCLEAANMKFLTSNSQCDER